MRLCLIADRLDASRGGSERYTAAFLVEAARRGHEVTGIVRRPPPEGLALPGVRIEVAGTPAASRAKAITRFAEEARRLARNLWPDALIATAGGAGADIFWPHGGVHAAMRRATDARRSFIGRLLRRLAPGEGALAALERARYAPGGPARLVAVSRRVERDMVEAGAPPERIRVIPNGADLVRFRPGPAPGAPRLAIRRRLGLPEDGLLLLHVAHHFGIKGLPELIAGLALARGAARTFRLVVVGGDDPSPAARLARKARIGARVRFAGAVADVAPYYQAADLVCQPTYYDPCSLVTLEAAASERAVITTAADGASEILRDAAVVLPRAGDPLLVRDAIERLGQDPDERQRLGERARKAVSERPFDRAVADLLALAAECAAERAGAPQVRAR